jgi:hypothetical protein
MDTPQFTVGEHWRERFSSGMAFVRAISHCEIPVVRESTLNLEFAVASLNNLALGGYQQPVPSGKDGMSHRLLLDRPPRIEHSTKYLLLTLNALTPRGEFVSVPTGGISFEDPFWAVLSAMALSQKKLTVLPKAASNEELWSNVSAVDKAAREGSYKESNFFEDAKGFVPPAEFPKFETITVLGEQLAALRDRGVQTLKGTAPPRFYELFGVVRK